MRSSYLDTRASDPLVGEIVLLLRKIIYAPEDRMNADTKLTDLGLDSLDLVEAGLELEAMLGRELPDAALTQVRTVGDLARCFDRPIPRMGISLAA